LAQNHTTISSSLADLSTIFELESERMDGSLERAKGFAYELERVAGDIIILANERRDLTLAVTKNRQLQMISTLRLYHQFSNLIYSYFRKWTG
jgi:hypothetical protein